MSALFGQFFYALRAYDVPVSLREYLTLLEGVAKGLASFRVDDFYVLSRACLVKDERHIDKFDRVFGHIFRGMELLTDPQQEIPEAWLRRLAERFLGPDELEKIQALGGFDELMRTLMERLKEQQERHQGGNKWIGTGGTSPFGAWGANPFGVRIGQHRSRHRRAVKVWDAREFRDFDDSRELGTRNIKVALRRLRKVVREGREWDLNVDHTIRATAKNAGYLDMVWERSRENRVKVLLLLDVGGSMDDHVQSVEELFSAARAEFKHLEVFYFHNCLYEEVWRDNQLRHRDRTSTLELMHTYGPDYKVMFVGDASMSPYEITEVGGSVEHWNPESGQMWLRRARRTWKHCVWINPVPEAHWGFTYSIQMIRNQFEGRMVPLTLEGLERATKALS